jgi:hypothetical protein
MAGLRAGLHRQPSEFAAAALLGHQDDPCDRVAADEQNPRTDSSLPPGAVWVYSVRVHKLRYAIAVNQTP